MTNIHPTVGEISVHLALKSKNSKVGPIPVSTTSAVSCPDACPLKAKGCYAQNGHVAMHWRKVTSGARGTAWEAFTASIAALPADTLWRHNQAGDLPGHGDSIDTVAMAALVQANTGRRGFTYTHKPMDNAANLEAVRQSNAAGFVINLSADNLNEADELSDLAIGPVVVVLDAKEGERHDVTTPAGRKVATCPATYSDDVTCKSCGLCQRKDRKVIVGFPAHGNHKAAAAAVARSSHNKTSTISN